MPGTPAHKAETRSSTCFMEKLFPAGNFHSHGLGMLVKCRSAMPITTLKRLQPRKRYWNEESTPLYPFGFGLSYAAFAFSNLKLSRPAVKVDESVDVSVDVENTSEIAADEVVQLYLHQQYGTSSRPVRELKGFQRVSMAPHEKKTLRFTLSKEDRTYWSSATRSWIEDSSLFDVWAGGGSLATLHGSFSVTP